VRIGFLVWQRVLGGSPRMASLPDEGGRVGLIANMAMTPELQRNLSSEPGSFLEIASELFENIPPRSRQPALSTSLSNHNTSTVYQNSTTLHRRFVGIFNDLVNAKVEFG
jgi:hypothetical protein